MNRPSSTSASLSWERWITSVGVRVVGKIGRRSSRCSSGQVPAPPLGSPRFGGSAPTIARTDDLRSRSARCYRDRRLRPSLVRFFEKSPLAVPVLVPKGSPTSVSVWQTRQRRSAQPCVPDTLPRIGSIGPRLRTIRIEQRDPTWRHPSPHGGHPCALPASAAGRPAPDRTDRSPLVEKDQSRETREPV